MIALRLPMVAKKISRLNSNPMAPSTRARGDVAETLVVEYLLKNGYVICERNFSWRGGELDIIARSTSRELVFIEVRSSARSQASLLRYTICPAKRRRLVNTMAVYESYRRWCRGLDKRFDVVWVESGRIEHWKNVIIW